MSLIDIYSTRSSMSDHNPARVANSKLLSTKHWENSVVASTNEAGFDQRLSGYIL